MMQKSIMLCSLFVLLVATAFAQRTIRGTVSDTYGDPLIGANVILKGTSNGTTTDIDGNYEIQVPPETSLLIFSYTGFETKEVPLGVSDVLDVTLEEGILLNEAVVTALGIKREKKALSYSVEEVGGDDLRSAQEANVVNAIAGKFSGVQVTSSGGQVGTSSRVVIRGSSSFLNNNQPLFVIDGVPVDNSQTFGGGQNNSNGTGTGDSPLFFGGSSNRGVDIDPASIASVSVLKGASATALYGSRAANGVILITTKDGRRSTAPTIEFRTNVGFSEARLPDLQTTYSQGLNGQYFNGNDPTQQVSTSWGARIDTLRLDADGNYDPNGQPARSYNNPKSFFQTGQSFDNALSISGGGDNSSYFVSYSRKDEEGIVRSNELERNSFLAKFSTNFTDKLTVGASMNYINTQLHNVTEGNGRQAYMWTVYGAPPSYDLQGEGPGDYLNPDGSQRLYRTNRNNPYFLVDNNGTDSRVNRFLPNLNASYQITPWLSVTNRLGADIYTDRRLYKEVVGTEGTFPSGRVYEDNINYSQINNDFLLTASKRFEKFGLDVTVGNQINERRTDRLFTQGVTLSVTDFFNLSNASTISTVQNTSQQRLVGVYGSATIDYNSFLYLTVTARNDWSSTLPKNNNSFFYPSISGSFVLTDAISALQNSKTLSFAKLRLGYAEVGNDASPYSTQTDLYFQTTLGDGQRGNIIFPYNGQNGFALSNIIGNPNLKPENTKEVEAGLELYLFSDRIRFEGSYYNRLSEQQIFQAPVAGSSGAVAQVVNAGSMRNEGVEILLEVTPISVKGFTWDIGATFTKNVNTVEALTDGVENIRLAGFTSPGIYIVRDQGYGVIWGSTYERNDAGQVIIEDNSDSGLYGLPKSVNSSLSVIGNTQPDWLGGLRNTFSYTNQKLGTISLTALLDKREGGDILNLDNFYLNFYGVTGATARRDGTESFIYPNSVRSDGQPNDIPVTYDENYWRNNWGRAQEEWVEDGSYLRLREVTLSYSLPGAALQKIGFIKGLSFALTGRNLFLDAPNFSGADPESSLYGSANGQGFYNFITPGTKSYNASLSVKF